MKPKSCELSWIVVSDLTKAKQFYTETLGFKVTSEALEYGWIELQGLEGGMRLGLSAVDPNTPIKAGQNAVVTIVVDNIKDAKDELSKKGVKLHGDIMEIPGHVKLQSLTDADGNLFQLVEKIGK